jgi:hypothetical protein
MFDAQAIVAWTNAAYPDYRTTGPSKDAAGLNGTDAYRLVVGSEIPKCRT